MSFSAANFITPTSPSSKIIRFRDDTLVPVGGMYVCNFKSVATEEETMLIRMADNSKFTFIFASATEAKSAMVNLLVEIDNLSPNCVVGVPIASPTPVAVPNTYATFKTDYLASTLTTNTIYQVTDAGGTLGQGAGFVFYTQFFTADANDGLIEAFSTASRGYYKIDLSTNSVVGFDDLPNKIVIVGNPALVSVTGTLTTSDFYNATVVTTGNVTGSRFKNTTVSGNDFVNVLVENSAGLILNDVTDSTFRGITGNFAAYDFVNVIVDKDALNTGFIGELTASTSNAQTYTAFINENTLVLPTLVSDIYATLASPFTDVVVEQRIMVPSGGIGTNKTFTVKDSGGSTIDTITNAFAGQTLVYRFNPVTLEFEKVVTSNRLTNTVITIGSNGQTLFSSVLAFIPTVPSALILTVNGVVQKYSIDFSITGTSITFLNADFSLETTDKMAATYF